MAKFVPARYIGHHAINLVAGLGPFFNADGKRRHSMTVEHGDILLMPEREILGQSFYRYEDTDGKPQLEDLGAGKRVKAEHAKLSDEELTQLPQHGEYEFHSGRADFEYVSDAELTALKQQAQLETPVPMDEMQAPPVESGNVQRGG